MCELSLTSQAAVLLILIIYAEFMYSCAEGSQSIIDSFTPHMMQLKKKTGI